MSHVTTTYFVPGAEVGLYSILKRPNGPGEVEPLDTATVPEGGQLSFESGAPAGQAFWLAGEGLDGWRSVQAFAKDGEPVDIAAALTRTRPADSPDADERRVHGSRGTEHRRGRKRK